MPIQTTDRCCCGLMHVKTGTWILIVVQIVLLTLRIVGLGQGECLPSLFLLKATEDPPPKGLGHTVHRGYAHWSEAVDLIMTILMLVGAVLVVVALLKHRANLMSFHIVLLLIYIS